MKRYSLSVIIVTALLLLSYAALVFIVDPFCQYRAQTGETYLNFVRATEHYMNAGYAKNADYDAVVLGSSVSENFRASQFSELFNCEAIKLSSAGAYSKDYQYILDVVFRTHEPRYVFYSVDHFAYLHNADEAKQEIPEYLYDDFLLNDVYYLLNQGILTDVCATLENKSNGKTTDLDYAYNWNDRYTFSVKKVLNQYERPELTEKALSASYYNSIIKANLGNITPFIAEHPDTEFYIFLPPYSILYWDKQARTGKLDSVLGGVSCMIETYLQYDNVRVFFFHNIPEICDLANYRESMHFSGEINDKMVEWMASGTYEVTLDNYAEALDKLKETVESFDFSVYFPD